MNLPQTGEQIDSTRPSIRPEKLIHEIVHEFAMSPESMCFLQPPVLCHISFSLLP
jgi:hypothetical protein